MKKLIVILAILLLGCGGHALKFGQQVTKFRSQPTSLSEDEVKAMLKKHDFFDSDWNPNGRGFDNKFDFQIIKGDTIVIDRASNLMWQHGGSPNMIGFEFTDRWIRELNQKGYAGFHDWRLPTLEEAMTLVEPLRFHIDPVFDIKQSWIWTCDLIHGNGVMCMINFGRGNCETLVFAAMPGSIRAVRSVL